MPEHVKNVNHLKEVHANLVLISIVVIVLVITLDVLVMALSHRVMKASGLGMMAFVLIVILH